MVFRYISFDLLFEPFNLFLYQAVTDLLETTAFAKILEPELFPDQSRRDSRRSSC